MVTIVKACAIALRAVAQTIEYTDCDDEELTQYLDKISSKSSKDDILRELSEAYITLSQRVNNIENKLKPQPQQPKVIHITPGYAKKKRR